MASREQVSARSSVYSIAEAVPRVAMLSVREHEVLELVAMGCNDAEIARQLFISHRTVRAHVTAIFTKLSVRNRVEAAVVGALSQIDICVQCSCSVVLGNCQV